MAIAFIFSTLNISNSQAAQVTNGLLVDLNASNPSSYPGSGTSWFDLASGDDTATLTNGPTFDTSTGSGIVNDGVDDYVTIGNRSALQPTTSGCNTTMVWAKVTTFTTGRGLFNKMWGSTNGWDGFSLSLSGTNGLTLSMNGNSYNDIVASGNNVFSLNTWTLFTTVTCFGGSTTRPSYVYVNGNSTPIITVNNLDPSIPQPGAPIQIANVQYNSAAVANMKVGAFAYYNRSLTTQEISDSYNYYLNYVYVAENSSLSLSSSGVASKGVSYSVTATAGAAGVMRFYIAGKRIPTCLKISVTTSPFTATCTFKPAISGAATVKAILTPTNSAFGTPTASTVIQIKRRVTTR